MTRTPQTSIAVLIQATVMSLFVGSLFHGSLNDESIARKLEFMPIFIDNNFSSTLAIVLLLLFSSCLFFLTSPLLSPSTSSLRACPKQNGSPLFLFDKSCFWTNASFVAVCEW